MIVDDVLLGLTYFKYISIFLWFGTIAGFFLLTGV